MKYAIQETTGFSLATIEFPHTKTVVAYISCDLHKERTAARRAVELLYTDALLSGAGKHTRDTFLDAINQLGATISISISNSVLTLFIRSKADVFPKALSLTQTMLQEPHFDKAELKRIKQTVTNVIKESKEDSRAIAHEELRNVFYGAQDRRYSYSEDSLIAAIKDITPAQLKALHTHVTALPWTCSIAGSKKEIELLKSLVRKTNKPGKTTTEAYGVHQQKPPHTTLVLRDIPSRQNIDFSIGAPIPITLHHPDFLPLMFGIAVLGKWGGFAGRLMSTVREQEGLTYGIYAKTETFMNEEQGYWRIMTFFAPEKSVLGLQSTFREIMKIHKEGITKQELTTFKTILKTAQALKNDSTSTLLSELHSYHLEKFSLKEIEEHKQKLLSVTLEEVNHALRTYLDPVTLTVSGAGPVAKVRKDLQTFMKSVA